MNAPEKTIKCFTFPENSLAKISYLDAIDAFFNEPFVLDTPSTHKFFREKLREIATKITERSAARDSNYRFAFFNAIRIAHVNYYRLKQTSAILQSSSDCDKIFFPINTALSLFDFLWSNRELSFPVLDSMLCATLFHRVVEDTIAPEYYSQAYSAIACVLDFPISGAPLVLLVRELVKIPGKENYALSETLPPNPIILSDKKRRDIYLHQLKEATVYTQTIRLCQLIERLSEFEYFTQISGLSKFTDLYGRYAANLLVRRVKPLVNEMALEEFCFLTKPRSDERFCSAYYAATAKLRELSLI